MRNIEKVEVRSYQEAFDHFTSQIKLIQEESRDCNFQLLWTLNLFLIQMIEALSEQLGFKYELGPVMEACSAYVSENFDELKREERKFQNFVSLVSSIDRQKEEEGGPSEE